MRRVVAVVFYGTIRRLKRRIIMSGEPLQEWSDSILDSNPDHTYTGTHVQDAGYMIAMVYIAQLYGYKKRPFNCYIRC